MLFIRRAINPRDPWSGNVALPGGRQDEADCGDDEATAIRETREEVGLDLTAPNFERFGRLVDDRIIHPRGQPMAVSMFGFAAREDISGLQLQPSEVADAWWVSTRWINAQHLNWRIVELHTMAPGLRNRKLANHLLQLLGCDTVKFAAIPLPPAPAADAADSATGSEMPLAATDARRSDFELWGLTLAFFSDLLRTSAAGQPLVGDGAPPAFRETFTSSSQSPVARATFHLLEHARVHGARRTVAKVAGFSVAVVLAACVGSAALVRRAREVRESD